MKNLFLVSLVCIFIGCGEENRPPHNIVNAIHIPINPFEYSVDEWALKMQNYFKYETLLASYKHKNYYFAVYRNGEVLHNLSVSTDEYSSNKSIPSTLFTDKNGVFVTDQEKTIKYHNKLNQVPGKFYTFNAQYEFRRDSLVINPVYLDKTVYVEIRILVPPKYSQSKVESFKTTFILK
jgi:hypothetical protein